MDGADTIAHVFLHRVGQACGTHGTQELIRIRRARCTKELRRLRRVGGDRHLRPTQLRKQAILLQFLCAADAHEGIVSDLLSRLINQTDRLGLICCILPFDKEYGRHIMLFQNIQQTRRKRTLWQAVDDDADHAFISLETRHNLGGLNPLRETLTGCLDLIMRRIDRAEIRNLRPSIRALHHMIPQINERTTHEQEHEDNDQCQFPITHPILRTCSETPVLIALSFCIFL